MGVDHERVYRRHVSWSLAAVGLLGASWALLEGAAGSLPAWERDVFEAVNRWPDWFETPLWPVMQLGSFSGFLVVAVVIGVVTRSWRPAAAVTIAGVTAWYVAGVVKNVAGRGRPADLVAHVRLRESGVNGLGFVSGHSAVAFATATVVAAYLPRRWRSVPFVVAGLVALARVYFGVHLPLDVIGGAGVGILCGTAALVIVGVPRRRDRAGSC